MPAFALYLKLRSRVVKKVAALTGDALMYNDVSAFFEVSCKVSVCAVRENMTAQQSVKMNTGFLKMI